jgi:hypothetical protein
LLSLSLPLFLPYSPPSLLYYISSSKKCLPSFAVISPKKPELFPVLFLSFEVSSFSSLSRRRKEGKKKKEHKTI